MQVNTDPKKIDDILSRFVEDVVVREYLRKEMLSGRELKIYLGTDVTGENLHLGHAVIHRKLKDFQELGHKVTLLIGSYTTLVGDHSDKLDQRTETNEQQISSFERTYVDQFAKTVDISKVEIVHNGDWLSKLTLKEVIELAKIFTVQQNIERDAFQKRIKAESPIGLDEFLYPLMQGYDAYALKTDIQIGGSDQTFNLHAGRKVMEHFGMKPQNYITMKLLVGNDGRKMGKSLMNFIPILATPNDMYGQLMSIKDEVMEDYFVALTRIPLDEVKLILREEEAMNAKKKLAFEVTKFYSSEKEAIEAGKHFERAVQKKGELEEKDFETLSFFEVNKLSALELLKLLVKNGKITSNSEGKRLLRQGSIEINGKKVIESDENLDLKPGDKIKVGNRRNVLKIK
ncbi:tyrosine--tRNA ligase [Candidatus Dojkabacteria bacterium]|nr:tyrosine--tRNA ligase [Candidatus Dojkabacteria bacterium]